MNDIDDLYKAWIKWREDPKRYPPLCSYYSFIAGWDLCKEHYKIDSNKPTLPANDLIDKPEPGNHR